MGTMVATVSCTLRRDLSTRGWTNAKRKSEGQRLINSIRCDKKLRPRKHGNRIEDGAVDDPSMRQRANGAFMARQLRVIRMYVNGLGKAANCNQQHAYQRQSFGRPAPKFNEFS